MLLFSQSCCEDSWSLESFIIGCVKCHDCLCFWQWGLRSKVTSAQETIRRGQTVKEEASAGYEWIPGELEPAISISLSFSRGPECSGKTHSCHLPPGVKETLSEYSKIQGHCFYGNVWIGMDFKTVIKTLKLTSPHPPNTNPLKSPEGFTKPCGLCCWRSSLIWAESGNLATGRGWWTPCLLKAKGRVSISEMKDLGFLGSRLAPHPSKSMTPAFQCLPC